MVRDASRKGKSTKGTKGTFKYGVALAANESAVVWAAGDVRVVAQRAAGHSPLRAEHLANE